MSWFRGLFSQTEVPAPDQYRKLVLYKYDACPFCARVQRDVDSLGLKIEMRDTRINPDARRELQAETGRTQVPCLFIDGQPLFESADISAWLKRYSKRAEA
jgi:glutaredoxin